MSDKDKGKKSQWDIILMIVFFFVGMFVGTISTGEIIYHGEPDRSVDLAIGNHQILAVVEVTTDNALVVLKHENPGSKPHYYKIEAKKVLNFEDISSAKEVIKVDGDLKYIRFK